VKTNVVTAIRILDRDAGDSPQFKSLLATTAENFTVKEASADKAYSSRENIEAITALGGFPAIAFRSGTTGAVGSDFERLFYYYSLRKDEFLKAYHKRSNVESTLQHGEAEVWRCGASQDRDCHEERGAGEVRLPQHLLCHRLVVRVGD
jgi:hypothetical protein